jgi:hypothetical protein
MKRLITAAALLLGTALAAHADTSVYTSRQGKSDAELQAAGAACDQQLGPVMNGAVTSPQYKRCMAGYGWRYQRTLRGRSNPDPHTWIDPDTGDTCHDILGGLGSACGNF